MNDKLCKDMKTLFNFFYKFYNKDLLIYLAPNHDINSFCKNIPFTYGGLISKKYPIEFTYHKKHRQKIDFTFELNCYQVDNIKSERIEINKDKMFIDKIIYINFYFYDFDILEDLYYNVFIHEANKYKDISIGGPIVFEDVMLTLPNKDDYDSEEDYKYALKTYWKTKNM